MKPIRLGELLALIPDSDTLRPLLDRMAATAAPDPGRAWAASGEVETLGDRVVDPERLERSLPRLLDDVRAHLEVVYGSVARAARELAAGRPEEAAEAFLEAAEVERAVGRSEEAAALAHPAAELVSRFSDRSRSIPVLIAAARLCRVAGRSDEAEAWYRTAAQIGSALGDCAGAARSGVGWGNILVDRGRWGEALARYEEAEGWVERTAAPLPERWHIPLNRSIIARRENRLDDAARELDRAREAARAFPAEDSATILDNAEGQLLAASGRLDEAEMAFRFALARAGDAESVVTVSANLADVLLHRGRELEAGEVVRQAEAIAIRAGVVRRLPELYTLLGRVAATRGNPEAFVFFERALEVTRDREMPSFERAQVLEAYAAHELQKGERESAGALLEAAGRIYEELGDGVGVSRVLELRSAAESGRNSEEERNGHDAPE